MVDTSHKRAQASNSDVDVLAAETVLVDEPDDGNDSDGDVESRHTFSQNLPARRSTLNVFSNATAEDAGLGVNVPKKRSSMTMIERSSAHDHREHML